MGKFQLHRQYGGARTADDLTLADYVGVSIATVINWRRDPWDRFPAQRYEGARLVTDLDEVDRWLRDRRAGMGRE